MYHICEKPLKNLVKIVKTVALGEILGAKKMNLYNRIRFAEI